MIGHFWIVARRNTADEILAAGDRRVNVPAIIGFLVGVAIAVLLSFLLLIFHQLLGD